MLSWLSLAWMGVEGGVGFIAGLIAGSIALEGFGLSSAVEGMASVIVIWRFTGSRMHSETAEHSAHRAVAVSFWILAPYVAVQSIYDLATQHHAGPSPVGIAVAASSIVIMPLLGRAKHRLGARLGVCGHPRRGRAKHALRGDGGRGARRSCRAGSFRAHGGSTPGGSLHRSGSSEVGLRRMAR